MHTGSSTVGVKSPQGIHSKCLAPREVLKGQVSALSFPFYGVTSGTRVWLGPLQRLPMLKHPGKSSSFSCFKHAKEHHIWPVTASCILTNSLIPQCKGNSVSEKHLCKISHLKQIQAMSRSVLQTLKQTAPVVDVNIPGQELDYSMRLAYLV